MSEIFEMAFIIIAGVFLFGIMAYVLYLGLSADTKNNSESGKPK